MDGGGTGEGSPMVWGLVLAAGQGSRFGTRKQFVAAAGRRLVDLAVATLARTCDRVVVVLPPGRTWDGPPVAAVIAGGEDRGSSVRRGLDAIPDADGIVVVHQAANPLASQQLVQSLITAIVGGAVAAAPGLRPADLVRRSTDGRMGDVIGRDDLVLVQTPAAFRLRTLRKAHGSGAAALEDTALVSAIGEEVLIVPGDPRNIHVATPEDLELVAALLATADG
jgi:2-C-methyl-D-erythritol 4-phosphate cytidylyltransferase